MTRRFNKAAVMDVWRELNDAVHDNDRAGLKADGSGVYDAAFAAWIQLASILGVTAEHVEPDPEEA